jgi:hypothetical protein
MSLSKAVCTEAAIGDILTDHFENSQNPHETIYRIWLLLNAKALSRSALNSRPDRMNCPVAAEIKLN